MFESLRLNINDLRHTEENVARCFVKGVKLLGCVLLYDGRGGVWYAWDGLQWKRHGVESTVATACMQAAGELPHGFHDIPREKRTGAKWAGSPTQQRGVLDCLQMLCKAAAERAGCPPGESVARLAKRPGALFKSCVMLPDGSIVRRTAEWFGPSFDFDPVPEDCLPSETMAAFRRFVCMVQADDARASAEELLWSFLGHIILGVLPPQGLWLCGPPSTGKSTYIELVKRACGLPRDRNVTLDAESISGAVADIHLSSLYDAALVTVPEADNFQDKHLAQLKSAILGEDMTARKRGQNPITFAPQAAFLFASNKQPAGLQPAVRRRLSFVPFMHRFTGDDADIVQSLISQEHAAIATYAVRVALKARREGYPQLQDLSTDGNVQTWASLCCARASESDETFQFRRDEAYQAYQGWANENGGAVSQIQFGKLIKSANDVYEKQAEGKRYYVFRPRAAAPSQRLQRQIPTPKQVFSMSEYLRIWHTHEVFLEPQT